MCAFIAAAGGLLFSLAFIVADAEGVEAFLLLLGGVVSLPVGVAVYERVSETSPPFALLALILWVLAGAGAAIHGGYDLANEIDLFNIDILPDTANPANPRGLLSFGSFALAVALVAWLISRDPRFPRGLAWVGYALGALLLVLYLGRLVVVDSGSLVVMLPALAAGLVASPLWYAWLGLTLWRAGAPTRRAGSPDRS